MKIYQEINSSNQTLNFQSKNIDFETEFPLVVKIEGFQLNDFFDFIEINCSTIEELTLSHGAVLLRGLPLTTTDDFDSAIQRFYWENFTYEDSLSNAVRVVHSPRVFSANEGHLLKLLFSCITRWLKLHSTQVNFFSSVRKLPSMVVALPSAGQITCGN